MRPSSLVRCVASGEKRSDAGSWRPRRDLNPYYRRESAGQIGIVQSTARDVISRWDVIEAHGRATSRVAAQFLQTLLDTQEASPSQLKECH